MRASSGGSARAGTPNGFPIPGYSGYTGIGSTTDAATNTTAAAAATLAHQRQWREGSDTVGVSSSTKPAQEMETVLRPLENPTR